MAQYRKAFDICAVGTYEAVRSGRLKVQPGQWVWCGKTSNPKERPSRFVSANQGYLNIVHPAGPFCTGRVPMDTFRKRCAVRRAS